MAGPAERMLLFKNKVASGQGSGEFYRGSIVSKNASPVESSVTDLTALHQSQEDIRLVKYADKLLWTTDNEKGGQRLSIARFLIDICLYPEKAQAALEGTFVPRVVKYEVNQFQENGQPNVFYAGDKTLAPVETGNDKPKREFIVQQATPQKEWRLNPESVAKLVALTNEMAYPRYDDFLDKIGIKIWVESEKNLGLFWKIKQVIEKNTSPRYLGDLIGRDKLKKMTIAETVRALVHIYEKTKLAPEKMQEIFASAIYGTSLFDYLDEDLKSINFEEVSKKSG